MLDINVKTVLLGNSKIGKTSLVRRFVENKFISSDAYMSTIGGAFISKEVFSSDGKRVLLCIWDTAGEEKFESVTRTFYRNANAAIVCYDVTCAKSWNRAKSWVSELRQFEEKCVIYLCATKMDLLKEKEKSAKRAMDPSIISMYVKSMNIKRHFETSSKTGENVANMFLTIAQDYVELNKDQLNAGETIHLGQRNTARPCCFTFLKP